jgi:hypothetical protein
MHVQVERGSVDPQRPAQPAPRSVEELPELGSNRGK